MIKPRMASTLMAALLLTAAGCSRQPYQWGWYEVLPTTPQGAAHLKFLLAGIGLTLGISILSLSASIGLGLLVALPGLSRRRWMRTLNRFYVEIFRSVPVLVMILWVYYGLPVVVGLALDPFSAGIVDKCMFFYAPKIYGGNDGVPICAGKGPATMAGCMGLRDMTVSHFDPDILVEGYAVYPT